MRGVARQGIARVLRWATGRWVFPKRLPQRFGGTRIYVSSRSDIRMLYPGFERSCSDLLEVAERYVRPGDCVWDLGSNQGVFAFCAAHRAGPSGSVYSLEADPRYAELQHRSCRNLGPEYARVRILCGAIADEISLLQLVIPRRGHARSHLAGVSAPTTGEAAMEKQVVSITGDFLLAHWPAPRFVKIDIEGAELLALRGSRALFEKVRPELYLECSPPNVPAVTEFLRNRQYRLFRLTPDRGEIEIEHCDFNTVARPAEHCG